MMTAEQAKELLAAAQQVLWKLGHNHYSDDKGGYPATIDRRDATVRMLQAAMDKINGRPVGTEH